MDDLVIKLIRCSDSFEGSVLFVISDVCGLPEKQLTSLFWALLTQINVDDALSQLLFFSKLQTTVPWKRQGIAGNADRGKLGTQPCVM